MKPATAIAPLEITRVLDISLEDAWAAWTDPALVALWFAPGAMSADVLDYEARNGGRYRICMRDGFDDTHTVGGEFIDVRDRELLIMSWAWEDNDAPESKVTVSFTATAEGTRIDILHEGLTSAESVAAHSDGWHGCLDKLPLTPARKAS